MTTVRCPSCDAAVLADASWCSLCFAPLGSAATAAADPTPQPSMPTAVAGVDPWIAAGIAEAPLPSAPAPVYVPRHAPVSPVEPAGPAPLESIVPVVAAATAVVDAPTWPCTSCSARVALDLTACPECGTPFMGGANPNVSLKLPGVGDLVHMSQGAKIGVMAGGAAVVTIALVLVFLILGHIF